MLSDGSTLYVPVPVLVAEGTQGSALQYAGEHWDGDVGLLYLRARWYDPATGRFLTKDPFPGYAALPQTQHPYVYVGNNPVNLTDPSGEIAPIIVAGLVGGGIGAVVGGASHVLAHPGGRPEDYLHSKGFWRAVGIGAASGAVAGAVGWAVPALLPAAGSVWGAMGIGALTGSLAGGAGQITANLLNPCVSEWHHNLVQTMLIGGVTGGILGGVGWGVRQWLRTGSLSSSPNAIGRAGERAAGITGPKPRIPSPTGTANYRVPDELSHSGRILREVKNVARLSYTSQLGDFVAYAKQHGYTFKLVVRHTTELSRPLEKAIQRGDIILEYLPW